MKSSQTFFFADAEDIKPIIAIFENDFSLQYFEAGLFDTQPTPKLNSLFEIKDLGKVSHGNWVLTKTYLVLDKNDTLKVRVIEQDRGGVKYAVDQKENENSIVIKPSGIFKEGIFVGGSVGTIWETEFSKKKYRSFSGFLKKKFKKVGNFYLGENAVKKLDDGWRLVTNDKSPVGYDLKYE